MLLQASLSPKRAAIPSMGLYRGCLEDSGDQCATIHKCNFVY